MTDQDDGDAETVRTEWGRSSPGQVYGERAWRTLSEAAGSGALATGGAAVAVLLGGAAVLRGAWLRGIVRLVLGGILLALAAVQRTDSARPRGEPIEVVDPGDDETEGQS